MDGHIPAISLKDKSRCKSFTLKTRLIKFLFDVDSLDNFGTGSFV